MFRSFLPAMLAAVLLPVACSVMEDRTNCPCELFVLSDEALKSEGNILVSVIQNGEVVKQGMMTREEFDSGTHSLMVPRGKSTVTFFSGITTMNSVAGRRLAIQKYSQCDRVYSYSLDVNIQSDRCYVSAVPHKNHVNIYIRLTGGTDAYVRVSGMVRGYDVTDLEPSEGIFICRPDEEDGKENLTVRIPRQLDDSLKLELVDDDGKSQIFPLGEMIAQTGYSYDDADLLDIAVTIDKTASTIFLNVGNWDQVEFKMVEFN